MWIPRAQSVKRIKRFANVGSFLRCGGRRRSMSGYVDGFCTIDHTLVALEGVLGCGVMFS